MRQKLKRALGSLTGIFLFGASLWVLHRLLKEFRYEDIAASVHALSVGKILLAVVLTVANYLVLSLYDVLAVHYVRRPLPWRQVGIASMVSYAFSNIIGLSVLTGGSVRYRFYAAWGLPPLDIARIVLFSAVTLWLGILSTGGVLLLFSSSALSGFSHLPDNRALGVIFLGLPLFYFTLSLSRRHPVRIRSLEFAIPSPELVLAQLGVGALDWLLAGAVLYALLPSTVDIGLPQFLGLYLVAQAVGLISHVPGGLGVFESLVLLMLPSQIPTAGTFGALLAYRLIYYLLPLMVAAVALAIHEARRYRQQIAAVSRQVGPVVLVLLPRVFAVLAFLSGAVLLFSAATPAIMSRMAWLERLVRLPVVEISHFLASLTGMGLLLLARGLQERLDAAWLLTVVLLGLGILFSLFKGGDYEEALILAVLLAALLPSRREFYRRSSLLNQPLTRGWITSIAFILICTLWLGFFSYKHLEYDNELWWSFSFSDEGHAPRALRAMVGVLTLTLFFAIMRLLRPVPLPTMPLQEIEWPDALAVICKAGDTYGHLALLGDKSLLFSDDRRAFIMYGMVGNNYIAMGDPVGAPEAKRELAWQFRERCETHGGRVMFYQVGNRYLELYIELGLSLHKIGEEARISLASFSMEGKSRKGLRNLLNKLEKTGYRFEIASPEAVPTLLPELRRVSEAWLAEKQTREKRFSLGFFKEDYIRHCPVALVRLDGNIVAFANLWLGGGKWESSVDLMRYRPDADHGIMDYLLTQLILWSKAEGYTWFNLGMAPLSGLQNRSLAPLWNRFGALIYGYGGRFYNFQGVRQYKEKFDPHWEPRYLALPATTSLPWALVNLAKLIAGGFEGLVGK